MTQELLMTKGSSSHRLTDTILFQGQGQFQVVRLVQATNTSLI